MTATETQRFVTLHLLRHGEALHNVVDWPDQPTTEFEAQYHDPPLTEHGENQVKNAKCPKELLEDKHALYFVSPLRRAVQTAIYAIPQNDKEFKVYDCMRERGGGKSCDLRRRKTEIEQWIKSLDLPSRWVFEETDEVDPLNPPVRRESIRDMFPRLKRTLQILDTASQDPKVQNIAIVSHSAFLSILMAVLDVCEYRSRWLKNAEWRSVKVSFPGILEVAKYKLGYDEWLPLCMEPSIVPKSAQVGNAAAIVANPFPDLPRVTVMTSDMLSSLAFSVGVNKRSITVLPYPLAQGRNSDHSHVRQVTAGWTPLANEKPKYVSDTIWAGIKESITPPNVMYAADYVYKKPVDARLSIHEEGLYACSHVVLLCQPEKKASQGVHSRTAHPDLPVWVSDNYLCGVKSVCQSLFDEIAALSVTVILPHDE